jgi:hypothetical protein
LQSPRKQATLNYLNVRNLRKISKLIAEQFKQTKLMRFAKSISKNSKKRHSINYLHFYDLTSIFNIQAPD